MEGEARTWWVLRGSEKFGPYTRRELRAMAADGNVVSTDLVWKEGLKAPVSAASIGEMFFAGLPPAPEASADNPAGFAQNPYMAPGAMPGTHYAGDGSGQEFGSHAHALPPGNGISWLMEAWNIFKQAPWLLLGTFILVTIISAICGAIPVIGVFLQLLLAPFFVVGPMVLIKSISEGGDDDIGLIFNCFSTNAGPLLVLGILWSLLMCGVLFGTACVGMLTIGSQLLSQFIHLHDDPTHAADLFENIGIMNALAIIMSMLIFLALALSAYAFAPALVYFSGMQPAAALRVSFGATWRNWASMLVFLLMSILTLTVLCTVLGVLLVFVPLILKILIGIVAFFMLLMWMPLMMCANYCCFRDMFGKRL